MAGKYALVVTDKNSGCFAADTTNIIDRIIYPKISAGQDLNFLCDNVNLKLKGEIFALTYSADILWKTNNGIIVNGVNSLSPEINKQGMYVLQVKDNSNDCISQDTVQIFPPSGEKINVIAQIQAPACNNPTSGIITLKEIRGGFPPYIVSFDGKISSNLFFQNLKGGQHFLSITDDIGCKTDTILLIKSPPEGLKISLGADQTIFLGDKIELPVTKNIPDEWIKNIQWEADRIPFVCKNCLAPEVFPFKTTTYKVTLTDINDCQSSDIQVISVDERGRIYAPTAFSPNGDGINDRFEIYADKAVENIEWMGIFDRWGTLVFEAKEFDPKIKGLGWDGTYLGKLLDPAVFVFAAKVKLIQGDTKIVKGEVTLMR
jgi:gliding motility-associated-like protein